MAAQAHGVLNNLIHEPAAVARLLHLPLRNKPPARSDPGELPQQGPASNPDGSTFEPAAPAYLFRKVNKLTAARNGPWVTVRMLKLGIKGKLWTLTRHELWREITTWHEVDQHDIAAALRSVGPDASTPHRPRAVTFVIDERCFRRRARDKVWDLRPYYDAAAAGRPTPTLKPQLYAQYKPSFNGPALRTACDASRVADEATATGLAETGIWRPHDGEYSLVLEPNARGFFDNIVFGTATTDAEIAKGWLSTPYPGPPFMPAKYHSRGVAQQFRSGKTKDRGTGNLTLHGQFQEHGTNAGWNFENLDDFPELAWASSESFARDCAVVIEAGARSDFEIRKVDWEAFYRQLLQHDSLLWLQCALSSARGATCDLRLIFGDASAPLAANRVQNLLLWLVRHFCHDEWGLGNDCSTWIDTVLQQPWARGPVTQAWIKDRAAAFDNPSGLFDTMSLVDVQKNVERLWDCIPCALSGFYDDGFWGAHSALSDSIQRGFHRLCRECGLTAQKTKFERATADEQLFKLESEVTSPDLTWRSCGSGHVEILGKRMRIMDGIRDDSDIRVQYATALTTEILRLAASNKRRLVPLAAIERCLGQWNFLTDTCKPLRGLLNGLSSSLKARPSQRARGDARKRAYVMAVAAHEAVELGPEQAAQAWKWSTWGVGVSISLAHSCDLELPELCSSTKQFNGMAWLPQRSAPATRDTVWIFNDSAGLSSADPLGDRAAACWLWSERFADCPFLMETWLTDVLKITHSTQQEAANGVANLEWAAQKFPWASCFIEVFDSQSTMHLLRKLTCKAANQIDILHRRRRIRDLLQPHQRILTLWNDRDAGFIADLLSKFDISGAARALKRRFPSQPLRHKPSKRPRNCINPAPDAA
jgi:hypothetical protein